MATALAGGMQTTTRPPTVPAIEAISPDVLFQVSGGCHHGGCQQVQQVSSPVQIIQMPPSAVPQAPIPAAAPSSGGDQVSTSVSINGQPVQ
jgi:hypothetical protein